MSKYKGQILFLHGFAQSSAVFYAKSSALRKKLLSLGYLPVYLNGPVNLTPAQLPSSDALSKFSAVQAEPEESTNYRAWWTKNDDDTYEVAEAIDTIRQYVDKGTIIVGSPEDGKANSALEKAKETEKVDEIPVVGLVGFSQGAGLAGLLVHKFTELFGVPLQFAVLYSGFKVDTKLMPQHSHYYTSDGGKDSTTRLLHVVGELDTVVGEDRAYTFYETSKGNSDLLMHPGGHFVPNSKLMVDKVTSWIHNAPKEEKEEKEESVDDLLAMMDKLGG